MAKKSRRVVSGGRSRAGRAAAGPRTRDLFTVAERKLLAETAGAALDDADRPTLQDRLKRVRGLRDKWRDLLGRQTRKEKRSPQTVAEANARSRDKEALVHAAVVRLERRIADLEGGPAKPAAARRVVKKSRRAAAHRATRAGVRAAMTEKAAELNRGRTPRPVAKPDEAPAAVPAKPTAGAAASARAAGTRREPRPPIAAAVGVAPQAVRIDRSKQRSARAGAKQARLALKGASNRRSGHVLASGKRSQARRDKRSR